MVIIVIFFVSVLLSTMLLYSSKCCTHYVRGPCTSCLNNFAFIYGTLRIIFQVKALLPYIPLPLARNFVGDTPQLIAVREKQLDIFRSLVLHGADLTSRNIVGKPVIAV